MRHALLLALVIAAVVTTDQAFAAKGTGHWSTCGAGYVYLKKPWPQWAAYEPCARQWKDNPMLTWGQQQLHKSRNS